MQEGQWSRLGWLLPGGRGDHSPPNMERARKGKEQQLGKLLGITVPRWGHGFIRAKEMGTWLADEEAGGPPPFCSSFVG
jgi:hypothetical protein